MLCFALLKASPTSSTPDPWKYRPLEEGAGQGFLYFFFRLELENSWNWNNFIFRKTNWLCRHIHQKWGILVRCCSNEGSTSPPIFGAVSGAVANFLSGSVIWASLGLSTANICSSFILSSCLMLQPEQVIAFNPGKNKICIVSCILSSPQSLSPL